MDPVVDGSSSSDESLRSTPTPGVHVGGPGAELKSPVVLAPPKSVVKKVSSSAMSAPAPLIPTSPTNDSFKLPIRSVSDASFREVASTQSSRSTKSATLVRKVSGMFRRKSSAKSLIQETLSTSLVESVSEQSTQIAFALDSTILEERQEKEKLEAVVESLETLQQKLEASKVELTKASENLKFASRTWMVQSVLATALMSLALLLDRENKNNAWFIALIASAAILLYRPENTFQATLDSAVNEMLLATRALAEVAHEARGNDVDEQESSIMPVERVNGETVNDSAAFVDGVPLPVNAKSYNVEDGFRLNNFADIPGLDFARDVLSKLPEEKQVVFGKFEKAFAYAFDPSIVKYKSNIPDQFTQLRFLQADKYDIEKAVARLLKTVVWRESSGLESFLDKPDWDLYRRSFALRPRIFLGFDKQHRPLYFEKLGEFFGNEDAYRGLSVKEWVLAYSFDIAAVTHKYRESVVKHGGPYSHRMGFVGDISGIRAFTALKIIPFLKTLVKEVETHFPEFAGPIILVNTPPMVARLYSLVKKFLDPATAEKVSLVSDLGTSVMAEKFGIDVVPEAYGGKNPIKIIGCPKRVDAAFNAAYPHDQK